MINLTTLFGAMALASGSLGYMFFSDLLAMGLKSMINLSETGMVYPMYVNPPFTLQSQFSLFAITNPREVLRGGKMSFQVKGPYRFETSLVRDNIVFLDKGDRVKMDVGRQLVADEAHSASFDEKMWLLNPILPGTVKTVRSMVVDRIPFRSVSEPIVMNAVTLLLDQFKERLIMRSTPRELLIGRKVELLESITGLAGRFGLASLVPPGPPDNVFGLAYVQNKTVDNIEIWTGVGDTTDKFGDVSKFRDKTKLESWRGKCNSIEGTNGELFKPLIEEGSSIRVFLGPLCRSLNLDPVGEGPIIVPGNGIRALEYELSPRTFWGARNNPDNKCFCDNVKTYECQYDGLMNIGPCFFDSPIFMAKAKFKDADDRIRRTVNISSLEATPVPDAQILTIEPITGTVLKANLTLMAVVKVVRQASMRDLATVRNVTYVPFFAATETISVPLKYVWPLYVLQTFNDYHKPIMATMGAGGLVMILIRYLYY